MNDSLIFRKENKIPTHWNSLPGGYSRTSNLVDRTARLLPTQPAREPPDRLFLKPYPFSPQRAIEPLHLLTPFALGQAHTPKDKLEINERASQRSFVRAYLQNHDEETQSDHETTIFLNETARRDPKSTSVSNSPPASTVSPLVREAMEKVASLWRNLKDKERLLPPPYKRKFKKRRIDRHNATVTACPTPFRPTTEIELQDQIATDHATLLKSTADAIRHLDSLLNIPRETHHRHVPSKERKAIWSKAVGKNSELYKNVEMVSCPGTLVTLRSKLYGRARTARLLPTQPAGEPPDRLFLKPNPFSPQRAIEPLHLLTPLALGQALTPKGKLEINERAYLQKHDRETQSDHETTIFLNETARRGPKSTSVSNSPPASTVSPLVRDAMEKVASLWRTLKDKERLLPLPCERKFKKCRIDWNNLTVTACPTQFPPTTEIELQDQIATDHARLLKSTIDAIRYLDDLLNIPRITRHRLITSSERKAIWSKAVGKNSELYKNVEMVSCPETLVTLRSKLYGRAKTVSPHLRLTKKSPAAHQKRRVQRNTIHQFDFLRA